MDSNSWLRLQRAQDDLDPALRSRDAFAARDVGWLEQMLPFVRHYAGPGELVLDPFCGLGTTLLAAAREGRRGLGFEVEAARAQLARERLAGASGCEIRTGSIDEAHDLPEADLCLTSVPYFGCAWPGEGAPAQLYASRDYAAYLERLQAIFGAVHACLREGRWCIVMAQNLALGERMLPLAWDVARLLGERFVLQQERILLYDRPADSLPPLAHDSNRAHEYALVAQKARRPIDEALARAALQALLADGVEFAVFGSYAERLRGAASRVPADLDLLVRPDDADLNRVLGILQAQGFELRCWNEPVCLPVRVLQHAGRTYFRARRVAASGARLQVDVTFEWRGASVAAVLARRRSVDGVPCLDPADIVK